MSRSHVRTFAFTAVVASVVLLAVPLTAEADAGIRVTSVPPYAGAGLLQGTVSGVDPAAYRVAPYIQIEGLGWWTKPSFANPTVPISPSGTFSVNVFTGGIDNRATIFCAALVLANEPPPPAGGSGRLPADLHAIAIDCTERYGRTITFAGRTWAVKEAPAPVGPGNNRFSDNPSDVWVDGDGLHLTIRFRDGQWRSSEVILLDRLAYGTYVFKTGSRTDLLDANATLGMFTWDSYGDQDVPDASPSRELDFEDSRWGVVNDPNTQAVVQPFNLAGNRHRYNIPDLTDDSRLTRFFKWRPSSVRFVALKGHHRPLGYPVASLFDDWSYLHDVPAHHVVPRPGRETVRLNLWLNHAAPMNGQTVEVVISDFQFIPLMPERVDFSRDGIGDIVLQSTASGYVAAWLLGRAGQPTAFVPVYFGDVGAWKVVATGDLNGDGIGDIILQNSSNSWVAAWLMNAQGQATTFLPVYFASIGGWKVMTMTDVNHDSVSDIILQNADTGWVGAWLMDGAGHASAFVPVYIAAVGSWRVVAAADLDGDDVGDLILQDSQSSWVAAWIMNASGQAVAFVPVYYADIGAWRVVGSEDINSDGVADLILQDSSSTWVGAWIMNGTGEPMSFFPLYFGETGSWRVNGKD